MPASPSPAPATRHVTTHVGVAEARRVDSWLGVTATGELLERDVWELRIDAEDLQLHARVKTFVDPSPEELAAAVRDEVARRTEPSV